MDHPSRVTCPRCETSVTVGLPRESSILAVTEDRDDSLDAMIESESRHKRRSIECLSGHQLYVYFEF